MTRRQKGGFPVGGTSQDADFAPDPEALHAALAQLIAAKRASGSPHADPDAPLELPAVLPTAGVGGTAALTMLAGPALDGRRGWSIRASSPTSTRPPWRVARAVLAALVAGEHRL